MYRIHRFIEELQNDEVDLEELLTEIRLNSKALMEDYEFGVDDYLYEDPINQLLIWKKTSRGHRYWDKVNDKHYLDNSRLCTISEFISLLESYVEPPIVKLIKGL